MIIHKFNERYDRLDEVAISTILLGVIAAPIAIRAVSAVLGTAASVISLASDAKLPQAIKQNKEEIKDEMIELLLKNDTFVDNIDDLRTISREQLYSAIFKELYSDTFVDNTGKFKGSTLRKAAIAFRKYQKEAQGFGSLPTTLSTIEIADLITDIVYEAIHEAKEELDD